MEKEWGFSVTRKRESRRSLWPPAWLWLAALIGLLLIIGATRAWSQSSGSSSSSSSDDLKTWETLSRKFAMGLDEQSTRLQQALMEMKTAKANSETLTLLLEQSLKANDGLKSYNVQIAERMQTRDEDLAAAYDDLNQLEKRHLKLIIAFIIAVVIIIALLIILIRGI